MAEYIKIGKRTVLKPITKDKLHPLYNLLIETIQKRANVVIDIKLKYSLINGVIDIRSMYPLINVVKLNDRNYKFVVFYYIRQYCTRGLTLYEEIKYTELAPRLNNLEAIEVWLNDLMDVIYPKVVKSKNRVNRLLL